MSDRESAETSKTFYKVEPRRCKVFGKGENPTVYIGEIAAGRGLGGHKVENGRRGRIFEGKRRGSDLVESKSTREEGCSMEVEARRSNCCILGGREQAGVYPLGGLFAKRRKSTPRLIKRISRGRRRAR